MRVFYVIVLAGALSGCITSQEQQIAKDDTQCQSYGIAKGSPEYVKCRGALDQQRSDRQASASFGTGSGLVGSVERANR